MHRFKSVPLALATLCLCLSSAVPAVAIAEGAEGAIAQTAIAQNQKAEGDRLLEEGNKLLEQNHNEAAIASFQKALVIYRELKERQKEGQTLKSIGNVYNNLKDYPKAIDYQQQALAIARELQETDLEARALNNLGLAYGNSGNIAKGIEYFQQAIEISQKSQNRFMEALASKNLGDAYGKQAKYKEAIVWYEKALPLLQKLDNRSEEAWIYGNICVSYRGLSKYEEAIKLCEKALPIFQEIKNYKGFHKAATDLGSAYTQKGDREKAIEAHKKALDAAHILKDSALEADSLYYIAINYLKANNLNEALEFSESALKIYQHRNDQPSQIETLGIISSSQALLGGKTEKDGNYKLAENYFRVSIRNMQEVLRLIEELNQPKFNTRKAILYQNLGNAYMTLGDSDNALKFLKTAINIAKQENNTSVWLDARLAELLIYQGQQSNSLTIEVGIKALSEIDEVLVIAEKHGNELSTELANKLKVKAYTDLSTTYFKGGDLKHAEEMAQQAIKLSQQKGIADGVSLGLQALIQVYVSQGKQETAIATSQKMLEVAGKDGNPVMAVVALSSLASFYAGIAEFNKSIEFFQEALKKSEAIDLEKVHPNLRDLLKQSRVQLLSQLSLTYTDLGAYEKARQFSAQARQFAHDSSVPSLEFDALLSEALTLASTGNNVSVQKAIDLTQKAIALVPAIKDRQVQGNPDREIIALAQLGRLFALQSNYSKALELAQQAAKLAQSKKDNPSIRLALETLVYIYRLQGDAAKSEALVQQYIDVVQKEPGSHRRSILLNQLGYHFKEWGDYSTSEMLLQKALEEARKGEVKYWIASIEQSLALVAWEKGDPKQALELIEKNSAAAQSESLAARLQYYATASLAYGELGNDNKAMESAQAALTITQKMQNRQMEKGALTLLGNLHRKFGRDAEALTAYESALAIRLSSDPKLEDRNNTAIYAGLANIYANRKQTGTAIAFYKQAINNIEDIRKLIKTVDPKLQQSFLQATVDFGKVKRADIYRQLADLLISQGRLSEAENILALLKEQEIKDFTQPTRSQEKPPEVVLNDLEKNLVSKYTSLITFSQKFRECKTQENANCQQVRYELQQQIIAFNAAISPIEESVKDRCHAAKELVCVLQTSDSFRTGVQAILQQQPGTLVISPLVLDNKVWILVAADGDLLTRIEVKVDRRTLGSLAFKLRQHLENPNSNLKELQALSHQLYQYLIEPIETAIIAKQQGGNRKITRLVFALDRVTRYIPMGVLFDGKQYLSEKYTISTVLSPEAPNNVQGSLPTTVAATSVLAMGVSQATDGFRALQNVPKELAAIVQQTGIYPGEKVLDRQFTRATLEQKLPGHHILHIATHGQFLPQKNASFLLLGNGKFPISEIRALNPYLQGVNLVVLSACQTALGSPEDEGIEIPGVSSYFLTNGAKSVLASLWSVDDASTSLLMQQFYKNLATGKLTKAEALQKSQLSLLQGKVTAKDAPVRSDINPKVTRDRSSSPANFSHPYYWAPFILIGNSL
jgi:CHAT domain-containing protein/ATP/maltotriose-dependent transcriptional regulator MalT